MNFEEVGRAKLALDNSNLDTLRVGLYTAAIRYAHERSEWKLLSLEERKQRDRGRTLAHNAFIDTCNIMSRNMAHSGEGIDWRAALGDDRKDIGDFACYLHCLLGLDGR